MKNSVIKDKPLRKSSVLYSSLFNFLLPFSIFSIGYFFINYYIFCKDNNITNVTGFEIILYFLRLWSTLGSDSPANYHRTFNYMIFLFIVTCIIYVLYYLLFIHNSGNEDVLGDAKWGTINDLKKYGLLDNDGVILGQTNDAVIHTSYNDKGIKYTVKKNGKHTISYNSLNHSMLIAPTRSGKGVNTVVPTCLSWNGSLIVFDPKAELWEMTSNYRSNFSYVARFSPLSENSVHINILDMIRDDIGYVYKDANQIADILLAKSENEQSSGNEAHFRESAKDLITGVILHVKFSQSIPDNERNMSKVLSFLSNANNSKDDENDMGKGFLESMIHDTHKNAHIHKLVSESAGRQIIKPDNERGSVFSTALRTLFLFNDYWLSINTSDTDFSIDYFFDSDKPISLYLTVPVSDIDRLSPIIRLLIIYLLRRFSESETNINDIKIKHRILFLIDEFPLLGKFDFIEKSLGILAGYNIVFLLISQSISQLKKIYGDKNAFFDNCKYWVTFATGDLDNAKAISEMIGKETIYKENVSYSQDKKSLGTPNASVQGQDIERNLINPNTIMQLPPEYLIFFGQGLRPYIGKKIIYFSMKKYTSKISNTKYTNRNMQLNHLKPLISRYNYEKSIDIIANMNKIKYNVFEAFNEPRFTF
jgi:type IV secretion system protein VirD4